MTKPVIKPENLRRASAAYTEVYNQNGLTVWATKSGKFELKCGSTTTVATNLMDVADKVDNLSLASFPGSGVDVVSAIKEIAAGKYRLEIRASKSGNDQLIHAVEGSLEKISDGLTGVASIDVKELVAGRRYAMQQNMYGGEYMILVPMSAAMMDLDTSFNTPDLYENQVFGKGMVLHGICPKNSDVITVLVADAYPNGSFKDADGKVWSADEVAIYQFAIGQAAAAEENFQEPDDALYMSEDLPTYNPVGVVKEQAPMIGNLVNYDTILTASADVISDFMKTCRKVAYLDKSSLNKVTVSAVNGEGQATDGAIEWNVRLGSPNYKRVSMVTIPLVMVNGSIDLGTEFITSTGAKLPLTPEAVHAHLGTLAEDMFSYSSKETNQIFPSVRKSSKAMDAVFAGVIESVPMPEQTPAGADIDQQDEVSASKKTAAVDKEGLIVGVTDDNSIISLDLDTTRGSFSIVGHSFNAIPSENAVRGDDLINDVMRELGDEALDAVGELSDKFWSTYEERQEDSMNGPGYIHESYSVNGVDEVPVNGVYYAFDLIGAGQMKSDLDNIKTLLIDQSELDTIRTAWDSLQLSTVKDPVDYDEQLERFDKSIADLEASQAAKPNDWDAKLLTKLKKEREEAADLVGTFSPEYEKGMSAEEELTAIWDKYPTSEQLIKAVEIANPVKAPKASKKTAKKGLTDHSTECMKAILADNGAKTLEELQRTAYKYTDSGVAVSFKLSDGTIIYSGDSKASDSQVIARVAQLGFSCIIEGSNAEIPLHWISLTDLETPEEAVRVYNQGLAETDQAASELFLEEGDNDTDGSTQASRRAVSTKKTAATAVGIAEQYRNGDIAGAKADDESGETPAEDSDVDYDAIKSMLDDKLLQAFNTIADDYELVNAGEVETEEIEHVSRDGFIPFTDGGVLVKGFTTVDYLTGSGTSVPNAKAQKDVEAAQEYMYELAKEKFVEDHPDIVEKLGKDNIDYHSLYEAGYDNEAEELSENERDSDGGDSVMFVLKAQYYAPGNSRSDNPDTHSLYMRYAVNTDFGYHRESGDNIVKEAEFAFNDMATLEAKVDEFLSNLESKYVHSSKKVKADGEDQGQLDMFHAPGERDPNKKGSRKRAGGDSDDTAVAAAYTLGVILWNADSEMTEDVAVATFGKHGTVINFENQDGLVQFGLQVDSREQALKAARMADAAEGTIDAIVQGQWGTIAENHDAPTAYNFVLEALGTDEAKSAAVPQSQIPNIREDADRKNDISASKKANKNSRAYADGYQRGMDGLGYNPAPTTLKTDEDYQDYANGLAAGSNKRTGSKKRATIRPEEVQRFVDHPESYGKSSSEVNGMTYGQIHDFLASRTMGGKKTAKIDVSLDKVYKPGLGAEATKLIKSYDLSDLQKDEPGRYEIIVDTVSSGASGTYQPSEAAEMFGITDQLIAEIKEDGAYDEDKSDSENIRDWEFSWEAIEDAANSLSKQISSAEQVDAPYDNGGFYFSHSESDGDYCLMYGWDNNDSTEGDEPDWQTDASKKRAAIRPEEVQRFVDHPESYGKSASEVNGMTYGQIHDFLASRTMGSKRAKRVAKKQSTRRALPLVTKTVTASNTITVDTKFLAKKLKEYGIDSAKVAEDDYTGWSDAMFNVLSDEFDIQSPIIDALRNSTKSVNPVMSWKNGDNTVRIDAAAVAKDLLSRGIDPKKIAADDFGGWSDALLDSLNELYDLDGAAEAALKGVKASKTCARV